MTSPARRHFERVSAALAAADAGEAPMQGEAYELMQAALFEDYRLLKSTQSMERKAEIKRELLPKYAEYVAGVLEAGQGAQDDVLMRVMLWRIDAGDLAGAIAIAKYATQHGLTPPDQFERGTPAIIAEEVADQALKQLDEEGADTTALLVHLEDVEALTRDADMHDQPSHRPARRCPAPPGTRPRAQRPHWREERPRTPGTRTQTERCRCAHGLAANRVDRRRQGARRKSQAF